MGHLAQLHESRVQWGVRDQIGLHGVSMKCRERGGEEHVQVGWCLCPNQPLPPTLSFSPFLQSFPSAPSSNPLLQPLPLPRSSCSFTCSPLFPLIFPTSAFHPAPFALPFSPPPLPPHPERRVGLVLEGRRLRLVTNDRVGNRAMAEVRHLELNLGQGFKIQATGKGLGGGKGSDVWGEPRIHVRVVSKDK